MTIMIVEVYEALRAIDVPDDKAKAAAQAVSQDMTREIGGLRSDIAALRKDMDAGLAGLRKDVDSEFRSVRSELAGVKSDVAVLRWMTATSIGLMLAIAIKIFVT
ncbi:MAG: hypothetical protein K2X49_04820 [Acetobacteraceae bacterium]|nr:hypothetical protein [Acetobacteraceae bacterium]